MSCVLHVWGSDFDAAAFLSGSPLSPKANIYNGDASSTASLGKTGFRISVSEADFDALETQIDDTIEFLDTYEDELRRLGGFDGVEALSLDFGIQWKEGRATQTDLFPPDLLWRMGALDIVLQTTHYLIVEHPDSADSDVTGH